MRVFVQFGLDRASGPRLDDLAASASAPALAPEAEPARDLAQAAH